ncbi:MAG: hypothetical protein K0R51_3162 [Cytophagaceae bacterium]|jgi:ATP/ADP translocase|nr:hypothetical protein [Cytophagaceae bacterium]
MITTTTSQRYSSDSTTSRSSRFFKFITLISLFLFFLFGAIIIRYLSLGLFRVNFGMLRKYIEMRKSLLAFSFLLYCL